MGTSRKGDAMDDFDLNALYTALDDTRQARGLTWAQATREINASGPRPPGRPIASSTIARLRRNRLAEADGVLQMLRWLDRSPESFVARHPAADQVESKLPKANPGEVLRVDTRKLFEALDAQRKLWGRGWEQLAFETGVPASHMRGLARGGRTAFPAVARLATWLNQPVAQFVRRSRF